MTRKKTEPQGEEEDAFCVVNGKCQTGHPGAETMLEWLREKADCTEVHRACGTGHCGACAVIVDGRTLKSCTALACELQGRQVFTLSGLARSGRPAAVALLNAIEASKPFQCGYCQPAFVFAALDLLERDPMPSESRIRSEFAGLLCRCTGYQSIVETVSIAARALREPPHRDAA